MGNILHNLQQGLIGHWDMNGNAKDKTPYGNNGTVDGATLTTDRFGVVDKAYNFTATGNGISVDGIVNEDLHSGFSVTAWILPNSRGLDSFVNGRIVDKSNGNAGNNGFRLFMATTANNLLANVNGGTNVTTTGNHLAFGVWSFVAVTFTPAGANTDIKIYINGIERGSGATNQPITSITATEALQIGQRIVDNGQTFDGKISDVRIYNRALSATEISTLYKLYNPNILTQ